MDDSKVHECRGHQGARITQQRLSGAEIARIMHPPDQCIDAHAHDWPCLSLFRIGGYKETAEDGTVANLDGPSAVFQPAGAGHADHIGPAGLETLSMTFDPSWLPAHVRALLPQKTCWLIGGPKAAAARELAEIWIAPLSETALRDRTARYLGAMFKLPEAPPPRWLGAVSNAIEEGVPTSTIAYELKRHPAWLTRAYRAWRGEGIAETARRRRVERAVILLRTSSTQLADIAADCGFCDQAHMNRAFRAVLARTPMDVRREAPLLAPLIRPPGPCVLKSMRISATTV